MATIKISFMDNTRNDQVDVLVVDTENKGSWFTPDLAALTALKIIAEALDPEPYVTTAPHSTFVMHTIEEG